MFGSGGNTALTFTSVGAGFEGAAVVTGCAGVTAGRLAGGSLVEITFTKSVVAGVATGKAWRSKNNDTNNCKENTELLINTYQCYEKK